MNEEGLFGSLTSKLSNNKFILRIYESKLKQEIAKEPKPSHIAVILDGNRRWALSKKLSEKEGHIIGALKTEKLLEWCLDLKIKTITLYVLSTENLTRTDDEKNQIFEIFMKEAKKALNENYFKKYKVRVKVLGKREFLPNEISKVIEEIEHATENFDEYFLNIALAYGGRDEITDAIKDICLLFESKKITIDQINNNLINSHLYTAHLPNPDPDLIIRTSGVMRLSNFLTWQSVYSELLFIDIFWPEFRKIDLWRAIRTYQKRSRRFGL